MLCAGGGHAADEQGRHDNTEDGAAGIQHGLHEVGHPIRFFGFSKIFARSIHSAASSGGVSRVSASHRKKSQVSLYDKISRNLSWFDSDGGGARTRRSSRQRSGEEDRTRNEDSRRFHNHREGPC